jgi:hypothetical protein
VKRGIGGVYHNVSAKYLQTYLDEYVFATTGETEGTSSFGLFWSEFRSRRLSRLIEQTVECIPRIGLHFLPTLIARFYLACLRHKKSLAY